MIIILAEGKTEVALRASLKRFLDERATAESKPMVALRTKDVMSLNPKRLRRRVELELGDGRAAAVVGLIDVYPDFGSAAEAKQFLRDAVGAEDRFFAHAAQFDVEAWLLPYWRSICQRIQVRQSSPGRHPELVDHDRPPSKRLAQLYQRAQPKRTYAKVAEMSAILRNQDLTVAAEVCPELRAFLNTLLTVGGLKLLDEE